MGPDERAMLNPKVRIRNKKVSLLVLQSVMQ